MSEVEWTQELVVRLVQEYQSRPELWDTSHESYRVQSLKYETWRELAAMFECEIADLRKKLNSLFASHRREKAKVRQSGRRSLWFLYPYLSFLPTHVDDGGTEPAALAAIQSQNESTIEMELEKEASSDEEYTGDAEEEDIQTIQEEVLIKEEPVLSKYMKPRVVRHTQALKSRIAKPVRRRVVKEYVTNNIDDRLSGALKVIKQPDHVRRKDECDSFGEYIADSLRKHDERTQSMIKQAINNILFEQEMKKYSANNQYTVVISGIDENPLILDGSEKYKS